MTPAAFTNARALTLLNPWGALIAHGGKTVENRSWMPWAGVYRILIHAGKGWDRSVSRPAGDVVTSAFVAVADLTGACVDSRYRDELVCGCHPLWAQPGQCHWRLANVVPLPAPVPAVGRQGLWRPTAGVLERVAAGYALGLQIQAAAR
jgi:hypothetical protein